MPSRAPGKVTAASSDGHSLTTSTPLLAGARYWQQSGAASTAAIFSTVGYAANKAIREGQRDTSYVTDWTPFPTI